MIKKFLNIFILLILLCGCTEQRISEVLFVASIGFENKEDGGYKAYFYLPVSEDIGNANNSSANGAGEFMMIEGDNIVEIFSKSQTSTELQMNLRHISSVILSEELLNDTFLDGFIDYVKYSDYLDLNFYIFITPDKIEDIYSFQNPNKESVLNSILVSTHDSPAVFLAQEPIHFLEFSRDYKLDKSIRFPLILVEEIWNIEFEKVKSYKCRDSIIYFNDKKIEVVDNVGSSYMKDNIEFYDQINKEAICIKNYKINIKYKEKIIIKVKSKYLPLTTFSEIDNNDVKELIERRITNYLNNYIKMDPLNLDYVNNIKNKNYRYDDIKYQIKIELY